MVQAKLTDISKFLTEDTVLKVFELKSGSKDKVKSIEVSPAALAGSGLIGAVYRLKVYGESHFESFIVKAMVQDPLLKKSLKTAKYFTREIYFYSEILPVLIEAQEISGGKERIQNNIPILYAYHNDGHNDFLLMEDLADSFCVGISENPTRSDRTAILKLLAHLHALSMLLELKSPETIKKITENYSELYYNDENRTWYAAYLQNAIDISLTTLAEYEDLETSIYYKKFSMLLSGDPYGKLMSLVTDRSRRSVISHGDAWPLNFLRSESRTVAIDFQISRFASPVIDLSYFVILCSKQCPNSKEAFEAFELYYDFLTNYMKDVGINVGAVYSWEELNTDLKTYGKFGLLAAITSFILLSGERCDVLDEFDKKFQGVDKIPLEELWPLTPFKTEDSKITLVNAVKIAVDIGLI